MAGSSISMELWKNWEKQGKAEFIKTCKQFIKSENISPILSKDGNDGLTRLVYELIWHGIRGPLRREMTVSTLGEIVGFHKDMPSLILDVVSMIDAETSCTENNTEERQRFCFIVKECEKFLSEKLLKERLEIDTLQDVGTLKNRNFYTKFIKVKTKLYYKQRKFNLFREESEGYAKLITELNQEVSGNVNARNILEVIKSLIGCFNLDPNRVLDIILESFECRPDHHNFFIPLLRSYMCDPKILCEVLGFKYCFYQGNADEVTPKSLYLVTALMLQHGIIALEDIYCWLAPEDKIIYKEWEKEMKEAKEYVRKLNIISTKEKDKDETVEEKENVQEKYAANQKFGLCEALLTVGDWNHAEQLTKKLPEHCTMEQPPVARALCQLLHSIMEPVYRKNCGLAAKIVGRPVPLLNKSNPLAPKPAYTFLELRENVIPMLLALGPSMHHDPVLMYKVLRIAKAALTQYGVDAQKPVPEGDTLYHDIITLMDEVILPSLSYMDCNCCIAEEVWNILKLYPYQCRYCLYSRWKNETYQNHAKLLRKRGEAQKKIKSIMKRVSKENIKPVGRLIGKLTHCSPGFLFDYVLVQIQIYDNLINPVVDSLKYLTSLSYDVLGYCLVESLASADRDRFKYDGTSISLWLQSLASFCGAIFKKYNIELTGLLQYVANQLKAQKSLDLLILKEIVQKMAGIEAAEEMTTEQLEAMAGGELLKGEAGYFSQVRNTKKSSLRLKEALSEHNLAVALCLLMAQQRYCVVYKETDKSHLKLVGKLYDQCQDTLVQFGTFLGSTLSMEEYVTKLPSIHSMLADYHMHADVAFFLARPMFTHAINLKFEALRKLDPNGKKMSPSTKHQRYCEAASDVMSPIVASVRPLHPPKVWEDISPQFLVTFWSLTMYDLFVPTESYQREINKLKQLASQAMDSKDLATKGKKEQERFTALQEKLHDEKKKQQEHVEKVMARLKQEKDSWFLSRSAKAAKNETITQFLQLCLFPRCIFTAMDAVYCAKFVHTIHSLKTANFSTLLCYDRLFCDITYSVTSCTENEANRYGRFLCAMLETVMRWHSEKSTFEKECANYPGFVTKFRVSNQFSEANDHVGYENYRHVCHKWHYKITKAMVVCLDSKDYVQIRNSLIILIKILPHFPVLAKLRQIIEKKIEKVREEEKNCRQDLFILATSYCGQLKAKSATMIRENDFHQVGDKAAMSQDIVNSKQESNSAVPAAPATKQVNGEIKQEKERSSEKHSEKMKEPTVREPKERSERKSASRQNTEVMKSGSSKSISGPGLTEMKREPMAGSGKEKAENKSKEKDYEIKEKMSKKEERREEMEREKRPKEKKEDKAAQREERSYREERYGDMPSPSVKEDPRYSGTVGGDRYYVNSGDRGHYYQRESQHEERDLSSLSNSSSGSLHRRSQEPPEVERDVKRRKMEGSTSSKSSKHEERKQQLMEAMAAGVPLEKAEKKDRSSKSKDKGMRDKATTEEEKELRKERKLGRKRDRAEEALLEQKRRKDEEKGQISLRSRARAVARSRRT
ncbi:THO complex subunit 2 isoform X2 [Anabrus simplex]|uniref:THO complex subunit 2 isoform X2 n=1 Tax=Anabrus simplex TaxID=316456 RepID=UPI0035A3025A